MRILRAAIVFPALIASVCLTGPALQAQGLPTPGVFSPQPAPPPSNQAQAAQKHLMKGVDYRRKGKINEAIAEFKAVIKLVPKSPVGYYQLASAYMAKGDLKSAEP